MKKINIFIIIFISLIFFLSILSINSKASSDKISMDVKSRMLTNENVPIIIILNEKIWYQPLTKENAATMLKVHASISQNELGTLLNKEKTRRKAGKIKQFWIVNAIAVNATTDLIERLSERDDVASIEIDSQMHIMEDYSIQVSQGQIDAATSEIKRINATKVWGLEIDGTGINVSVIDTGIYAAHPDISGRVIKWVDYIGSSGSPYDDQGHGTHVAGTVGGNGSSGTTTGVAPNVSLFGAKVLDSTGSGYTSDIVSGIEWSVDNKADIISLSLSGGRSQAMTTAINNAINAGVTVIAAAGNCGLEDDPLYCPIWGNGSISFPAGEKNVIAVGAVDSSDNIASFSSRGPITVDSEVLTKPDVSAPGVCIDSLSYIGGYALCWDGTSMATPHVSGAAALLLQTAKRQGTILTPAQVKSILENTSIDLGASGKDNIFGAGRINVSSAISYIQTSPSMIVNPTTYETGSAAKNGSNITINATITDSDSGVKNATVYTSPINSGIPNAVLTYSAGYWINNSISVNVTDGIYLLNITSYDYFGNFNNQSQVTVIVDNIRPSVTINPVSYQRATAAKTGSIIQLNVSANDPVVNSTSSGLKNASVNVSLINNTGIIVLTNNSGFWKGNVTLDRSVDDGNYSLNVSFSDNASNINSSEYINVTIDNTPPSVTDVSVSSVFVNATDPVNITANITSDDLRSEVNASEVFSRVKYPNGTSINYPMNPGGGSLFYYNFTDTIQYGRFNITIVANDTTGNTNSTQIKQFATVLVTINTSVETNANNDTMVYAPGSNTTLRLFTNNTSLGAINITQSRVNISSLELNITNPGIYVLVNASQDIRNNLTYVVLSVNYTDADVSSFVESSLRLYRWNTTSSEWEKLSGPGSPSFVNDAGVDTVNNFVWANLTNLSEFAIGGNLYTPPSQQTASSGGGGGGGGGGKSGENVSNIELIEKYDLQISKDALTSYRFTDKKNPIMYVNITGNTTLGIITASVEVLKGTSTLVSFPPEGLVYKNANIWVGTVGLCNTKEHQGCSHQIQGRKLLDE